MEAWLIPDRCILLAVAEGMTTNSFRIYCVVNGVTGLKMFTMRRPHFSF
jgi:hypothetical protein